MNTTPRKFYNTDCINHGGFRYFRDEDSTTRCSGCNEIISTPDLPASGQHDKKLSIYKDGIIYEGYYTSGISHSFDLKLICLEHCFKDGQNVTGLYTKRYEVDISAGNGKWEPVSAEYFNTCKDEYRRVIAIPTSDKKLTPMAAHIEWLKKERKTLYEFGYDVAADRISKAIDNATTLLEAEREYASQQAPAIPYQCCPICNGEGKLLSKLMTTVYEVCSVCKGDKIIPMFTASQQAPEGMYTREQIKAAFDAGYKHGWGQSEFEGESVTPNFKQFIQSLK